MSIQLSNLREYLSSRLWFLPGVGVVGGILLASGTLLLEPWFQSVAPSPLVQGDLDTARGILTLVAASMLTFTALVFSITLVVLNQAASQYSPRVMRTFLHDRVSQLTLATFLGTFSFSLLVLRFASAAEGRQVPHLGTWSCFLLVLVCLFVFVGYLNHIVQSIRVGHITRGIARETSALIDRCFPDPYLGADPPAPPEAPPTATVVWEGAAGVLANRDVDALTRLASERACQLVVLTRLGDFVPRSSTIAEVHGPWDAEQDDGRVRGTFHLQPERTMQQDPAFGLRQLVDIAARALSPGVNDPTTAVQAVDQLHDLLLQLAGRELAPSALLDEAGLPRVFLRPLLWEDAVSLALDEVRLFSEGSLQLSRRLRALLEDLLEKAPAARQAAVREQLQLLERSVSRGFQERSDQHAAAQADEQGLGS